MPKIDMEDPELIFLPLGGAGEFGTNLNLYGIDGKWLMVDCGMGFAEGIRPGVEILLPDPQFIVERKKDLLGLIITHAHEDHVGAIAQLWPRFECPIYASPFAAHLIRGRFLEKGLKDRGVIRETKIGSTITLGPFGIEFVPMTHSTLEPSLLAIRTRAGTIIHTGDWKLDPDPVVGALTDEARLKAIGEEGVLALVGDSTNATVPGHSRSESDLLESLTKVFSCFLQRIIVTCFSSNVARMVTIQRAAAACNRQTALIGRSLWRMEEAAREVGYLEDIPPFLTEHEIDAVPRRNLVMICTGSQGEPRSALSRLADGSHPHAELDPGDAVIFSARPIPGNEKVIGALQSQLAKQGVEIVTPDEAFVHVSGHPQQEELIRLYQWLRPQSVIPTHGEYPHMVEHARIARECQVPHVLVPENGALIHLSPNGPKVVDHTGTASLAVDGSRILKLDAASLRARQKISFDGSVVCSLVLDRKGRLMADPAVSAPGLLSSDEDKQALRNFAEHIRDVVDQLPIEMLRQDGDLKESVRLAIRRYVNGAYAKKPWIEIHILRVQ